MPRRCTACAHPDRADVNAAVVAGQTTPAVASRFGLSVNAVKRHRAAHVPAELAERLRAPEVDRLAELSDAMVNAALKLLRARGVGARDVSAAARVAEVRARLEGRFGDLQGVRPRRRSLLSDADWWGPLVAELDARGAFVGAKDDDAP